MEMACTPDKTDLNFFEKLGIEVFDGDVNPCIDPTFEKGDKEVDRVTLARRMKNHLVRLLLAWWKAAHYTLIVCVKIRGDF